MTSRTGLLVLCNTSNLYKAFTTIQNEVESILYVQFVPDKISHIFSPDAYLQNINRSFYKALIFNSYQSTNLSSKLDIRILLSNLKLPNFSKIYTRNSIDVIYFDYNFTQSQISDFCSLFIENKSNSCSYISLPSYEDATERLGFDNEFNDSDNVVVGGTFDKLHHGHKILLSEAILRCRKRLTVGVSDNSVLKSKVLPELIDPCEYRMHYVEDLLRDLEPNLTYDVVPIYDVYGPTRDDPSFQMLIASADTLNGVLMVNTARKEAGLNELEIVLIDLLNSTDNSDIFENKVSSSSRRMRMLGTLLLPPEPNPTLAPRPYIIGLTGGIASGKTAICDYLSEEFGAKCVMADKLGHNIFETDDVVRSGLVEKFGMNVFNELGQIDRQKLGNIVFNDRKMLDELNQLLWPAILRLVQEEIKRLFEHENCDVIIVEAALLIQANWHIYCHEIWCSIIPRDEAVKRLQARNNYTVDEALARISKQPTNEEYVKYSNVVFCTLWQKSFTESQARKAWTDLQKRLLLL